MLPLEILKGSKDKMIMIQTKKGDVINGTLESIDNFMNVKIKDITYTNDKGNKFFKAGEIFIRGNSIQSVTFQENLISELEKEKEIKKQRNDEKNLFLNKKRGEEKFRARGAPPNVRGRGGVKRGKSG